MKAFVDLTEPEQVSIILISILEDIAQGRRTYTSVAAHVTDLYNVLSLYYDVDEDEVILVADAVAKYGLDRLPTRIAS